MNLQKQIKKRENYSLQTAIEELVEGLAAHKSPEIRGAVIEHRKAIKAGDDSQLQVIFDVGYLAGDGVYMSIAFSIALN